MRGVGLVADIAFLPGVRLAPVLGRHPEEGHVQHVRLTGLDQADLRTGQFGRDQIGPYRVGMDAVVDLGQLPFHRPAQLLVFGFFEPLRLKRGHSVML